MAKKHFDNFARFVEHCGDGDANTLLSNDMTELARHLAKVARDTHQPVKGEIVIKLKFIAEPKGQVDVAIERKSTLPKQAVPNTVLWLNEKGEICWDNPRQAQLPGLAPVRDINKNLARVSGADDDNTDDEGDSDNERH